MLSQNTSLLSKLEVPVCDIFKCAEKDCLSSDVKKYVEAQYYNEDNPVLSISPLYSEKKEKQESCKRPVPVINSNCITINSKNLHHSSLNMGNPICFRKLEVRLHDILKNSNKKLDLSSLANEISESEENFFTRTRKAAGLKINSESERSSEMEVTLESESSSVNEITLESESSSANEESSESEKSSEIESVYGDEDDDVYSVSSDEDDDDDYFPHVSKKKISKKRKLLTKKSVYSDEDDDDYFPRVSKKKISKKKKLLTKKDKELTDYEKLIQKSREEKMAFLKSLQIDEIKEDIKEATTKIKTVKKRRKFKLNRKELPERKSSRTLTLKSANLSEDFMIDRAYSQASEEQNKIEAKSRKCNTIKAVKTKTNCKGKSNISPTEKRLIEFLISALNSKHYGNLCKWIDRKNYCFCIRWSSVCNPFFQDYDKVMGHYHPELKGSAPFKDYDKVMGYYHPELKGSPPYKVMILYRIVLNKCSFIKKIPHKDTGVGRYQFLLNADKMDKEYADHLIQRVNPTYKCDVCGMNYRNEYYLAQHSEVHRNMPPSLNEVCGKSFATNNELDKHRLVHAAETSGQSNATQAQKVLFHLKPPTDDVKAKEPVKMGPKLLPKPNSTSSMSTDLTSALVPRAVACHDLGILPGTSGRSMLLILKKPVDTLNGNKTKQSPMSEPNKTKQSEPNSEPTSNNPTSTCLKPQFSTCHNLGLLSRTSGQSNARLDNTPLIILKPLQK